MYYIKNFNLGFCMSWRLLGLKGADRDNAFDCGFRGLFYTIFDVGVLIGAGVGNLLWRHHSGMG
ncbi:MAG: hypothetical protein CTY16_19380 [Methylobacter sp.]|nr:MAG: hypothetical protein CTY16_19380 [Methylobacter sp.]